jgi:archaellum component FlaC
VPGIFFQPTSGERVDWTAGLATADNGRGSVNGTLLGLGTMGRTLLPGAGDVPVAGKHVTGEGWGAKYYGAVRFTDSDGEAATRSYGLPTDSAGGAENEGQPRLAKRMQSLERGANNADDSAVKLNHAAAAYFNPSQLNAWYFQEAGGKQAGTVEIPAAVGLVVAGDGMAANVPVASSSSVEPGNNKLREEREENVTVKSGAGVLQMSYDGSTATPNFVAHGNALPAEQTVPAGGTTSAQVEPPPPPTTEVSVLQARKIIRNGDMEFEVDSFDTAFATISRIVGEEKGYVSSTSSEKLPNGKVRGLIVVRVVPDRLDTLVLKLRALGDLKSQKISAQDITKVYYDLDSELRAAHTMEERILNIIKTGKGEVKDLIEAEKQLGTYREKIEKLEGEIRYYNNMVSLSTLNITAAEKAISSPATVQVTENVSTGIETEDVEKARADAIKGIEELKGRVVDSNLKKYDGGQFAANITAEIAPESSGQLIDRLRQIGRVTRLDIDRKQSSAGQALPNAPAPRVEKKDTRFVISIYNLANIAPRQTTTSGLAVANVEEAYNSILAGVKAHGGRVVSSNLNQQKPEQTTAAISFEVPADQADATLMELRRDRAVMTLAVAENPDTQNVTAAKHGFVLQLSSLASVAPRETETLVVVSKISVTDAFRKLLADLAKADARILTSQLNEQDASNLSGSIDIEVMRAKEADARTALAAAGIIFSRNVARSSDMENTVDTKVRMQIRMVGLNQLAPAQTARLSVETPDVETRAGELKEAAVQLGGRVLDSRQMTSATGQVSSRLLLDVPLAKAREMREKAQDAGKVRTTDSTQNPVMLDSPLARARIEVNLTNASPLVSEDSGLGAAFRKAIATSVRGLLWSVQAIIIGALIVIPWAAILWGGWKVVRRRKAAGQGQ